jgi:gamma-glutamylcyclotransferase (GGCT)/AIG2-like uncharacterized protein YtfP
MNDETAPVVRHRVFVYGSLRRGECNHDTWFGRGAAAVADGFIRGAELVALGDYCCIVSIDDPTRTVLGEVYDITTEVFRAIEHMEVEAGYVRRPVEVYPCSHADDARPLAAEAYFYSMPDRVAHRRRIESGDWSLREASRPTGDVR